MIEKIKNNFLLIVVIINILYLLIGSFLESILLFSKLSFSYGCIFVLLPLNIIVSFMYRKKFKRDILYLLLFFIGLLGIVSTIFAYNHEEAIFGLPLWNEGILMLIYYYSLFLISSILEEKSKKIIIHLIIVVGVINILFGFCQKYRLFNVPTSSSQGKIFFSGLCGNPNFMGTLMTLCISYLIGLYFDSKNCIAYYLFILFFMIGLLMSDTLSALVGLLFVIGYVIVFSIKYKKIKKLIILLLSLFLITFTLHITKNTSLVDDFNIFKKQTKELVTNTYESDYNLGTGRVYVWKKTLSRVPYYFMIGVGVDNFTHIMNGRLPIYRYDKPYGKAHNEYLQILITEGIYCFIAYLLFYFIIFKRSIVNSYKRKELYLVLPLIGYFVQAFFNISVIDVAPLVYITLGMNTRR